MKPEFSAIPGDRLRIDQEDFKASDWTRTTVWGVPHLMSECYELVGGSVDERDERKQTSADESKAD